MTNSNEETRINENKPEASRQHIQKKWTCYRIVAYVQIIKTPLIFLLFNSSYFRDEIEKWIFLTVFLVFYLIFLYFFYWFSYSEACHPNYRLLKLNKKSQWELKPATTGHARSDKKKDDAEEEDNGILYCQRCENMPVDKTTIHCKTCNKCVIGFDHHCYWMNKCVGTRNYGYFIMFVITLLIVHVIVFISDVIMIQTIKKLHDREDTSVELKNDFDESHTVSLPTSNPFQLRQVVRDNTSWFWTNLMLALFFALLNLAAVVVLLRVLLFHMYLWKKGITTYEQIKNIRYLQDEKGKPLEKTSLSASFSEKSQELTENKANKKISNNLRKQSGTRNTESRKDMKSTESIKVQNRKILEGHRSSESKKGMLKTGGRIVENSFLEPTIERKNTIPQNMKVRQNVKLKRKE